MNDAHVPIQSSQHVFFFWSLVYGNTPYTERTDILRRIKSPLCVLFSDIYRLHLYQYGAERRLVENGKREDNRREAAEGNETGMEWVDEILLEHTVCASAGTSFDCHLNPTEHELCIKCVHNSHPFCGTSAAPLISEECTGRFPLAFIVFPLWTMQSGKEMALWSPFAWMSATENREQRQAGNMKSPSRSHEDRQRLMGRHGWPGLTTQPGSLTKATVGWEPTLGEMFFCH